MARLLPWCLVCAGALMIAADVPPEAILLQRVRARMARNLARLPNYTCLQTIERSVRTGPRKKPRVVDLVRIEVALVHGKELFAWPGSGRFLDTEISDMVGGGAIGTGNFAGLAKSVFQTNAPRFSYAGQQQWNGRQAHRWDFEVAQLVSGYTIRVGDREAVVGYHGSFWVDAANLDLLRLEVSADSIPPHLQLEGASDAIEYAVSKIGDADFLLPMSSEMQLIGLDGAASINRTTFGSCRHYTGESVLIFEEPAVESTSSEPVRALEAPGGIDLHVELDTPIRLGEIAVGDPVTATLKRNAKIGTGIIAPKGAVLRGRLTFLREQQFTRFPGYDVGLQFDELRWDNTHVSLKAVLEDVTAAVPQIYSQLQSPMQLGRPRPGDEAIMGSIFFVRTNSSLFLRRGLRMVWRTKAMQSEERQ